MNSVCLGALTAALLALSALASPDAPIPLDQLGAVAGQQYQGDGLAVNATTEGAQLRCVFQRLIGRVTPEGLWLESTEPGGGQLHLRATAIGRETGEGSADIPVGFNLLPDEVTFAATDAWPSQAGWKPALPRTGSVSVQDGRVQFRRPGLVEEYSVSMDGLRQDFIIETPPASERRFAIGFPSGDDPKPVTDRRSGQFGESKDLNAPDRRSALRLELELTGARAEALPNGVRLTLDGSGRELAYSRLRVTDATGKELPARMEVATHSAFRVPHSAFALAVLVDDADAVYPVRIDPTFSDADWVSLNPGIPGANGAVFAIAVDANGHVYVGGEFTFIGTVAVTNLAKWDGSAWSPLGSGMNGSVSGLAISGTNLYAGGAFTAAGGVTANRIAKWNGSSWSALGSGMSGIWYPTVFALATSGPDLYAGGRFSSAGGVTANAIAKWNGSAWSALGSGMSNDFEGYGHPYVTALAVNGTDLYAAGNFTWAGGIFCSAIAKWNGSTWSALASGMDFYVWSLALNESSLYAGGSFTTAGGVAANRIARWNGSSWSALGQGLNGNVYALAVSGASLYAGGSFTTADGLAANRIAQWDGSSWSTLGSGMDGHVTELALDEAGHLFVGGDFYYAGDKLSPFIAQANLTPQPMVIEGIRVDAGLVTLDCRGAAGAACEVQRATDVQFTQDLTTLHTTNAPPDGRFTCTDSSPPATTAFYRLYQP